MKRITAFFGHQAICFISSFGVRRFKRQNNIIEIAPSNINVVDRIERVITEATLLLEGSNQIYKENCPLCGSKSIRRRESGEYCCEDCDGIWAANTVNNLDTIWLKRIRLK